MVASHIKLDRIGLINFFSKLLCGIIVNKAILGSLVGVAKQKAMVSSLLSNVPVIVNNFCHAQFKQAISTEIELNFFFKFFLPPTRPGK